ncbi:MAG: tRNA (adenosine(37)-N6)-threonylcarbamoyltransferase complex transferase subunit TsaD [Sphaerochaetaceae bacterium]
MKVLGIETSCDECSASVVEDGRKILSNVVATQLEQHRPFYGVVPEIASRIHIQWISAVVKEALKEASVTVDDLDGIGVTNRPGLLGSLLVGVNFAKALSATLNIPIVAVDHIKAHLHASQIESPLEYPYLGLLVSGGHTIICKVNDFDDMEVLGTTIDDAIGEAFDKVAKHYNLGYPGGLAIDKLAQKGNQKAFLFPGSKLDKGNHVYDVSYSGLKTAVINQLDLFWDKKSDKSAENIAASFQRSAVGMIVKRVKRALKEEGFSRLAVGGGVGANSLLRKELKAIKNIELAIPSMKLCTDNAAMIGSLAYHYIKSNRVDDLNFSSSPRVAEFKKSYP